MARVGRPPISEAEALRRIDNAINAANKRAARTYKSMGKNSADYINVEAYMRKMAINYGITIKQTQSGAIQLARKKSEMNFSGNTTMAAQMNRWFEANYHMGEHKKELEDLAKRQYAAKHPGKRRKLSRTDLEKAVKVYAEQYAQNQKEVRDNLETLYAYEGKGIEGVDNELAKWKEKGRKTYDRVNTLARIASRAQYVAQMRSVQPNDLNAKVKYDAPANVPEPLDLTGTYEAFS